MTQKQGNGNVWIGPAIAIGGDAETTNYQGNGNKAKAEVEQENDVDQSQSSKQKQEISGDGGSCCESKGHGKYGYEKKECCHGSSQTGEQKTSFGDQTVGKQENDADVTQKQGNDNFAFAPAVSFGGNKGDSCSSKCGPSKHGSYGGHGSYGDGAETTNYQGNEEQGGGRGARQKTRRRPEARASSPEAAPGRARAWLQARRSSTTKGWKQKDCCERELGSQTGSQTAYFGDQTVEEQRNDADVTQKQGNDNVAFAPALSFGGSKEGDSCNSKCGESAWSTEATVAAAPRRPTTRATGTRQRPRSSRRTTSTRAQSSYQRQIARRGVQGAGRVAPQRSAGRALAGASTDEEGRE